MAKKPVTAGAPSDIPAMDYAEHERTYHGFVELLKLSILGLVILMVGLFFIIQGGQPLFGGVLIFAAIIAPPLVNILARRR
ncbi:hypothetical protein GCM10011321_41050 [Youhaiella tibetensis]|uniref:Aa3-type cytochrome c oxidase subunit IV n=1 Tax=Paradevosia tibetensis TaxID=1447062 RepID=A0A5B9DU39_9HYPH|nr:aa3-type cytochrome c oxidase subunit IV [Youhaiella tibetensis]AKR56979.1 hypothetical protein XM25_14490 [Devosia sp. H5989]QEE21988.1 aa3-type cytochrome c oxidase subunit IV [Youhaiella tibetensis]GGF46379.1 hypothetical protein GCM10011321_41050 [Youhaiella tibetensis]